MRITVDGGQMLKKVDSSFQITDKNLHFYKVDFLHN